MREAHRSKPQKVWLVFIDSDLIDVLSARRTFENIVDYAKNLYRSRLTLKEKLWLADYKYGKERLKKLFREDVSVKTHYTTEAYKKLTDCINDEKRGLRHPDCDVLWQEWAKNGEYVIIGKNPAVIIKRGNISDIGDIVDIAGRVRPPSPGPP